MVTVHRPAVPEAEKPTGASFVHPWRVPAAACGRHGPDTVASSLFARWCLHRLDDLDAEVVAERTGKPDDVLSDPARRN